MVTTKPQAAFVPAIGDRLPEYTERLFAIKECPFWIHESRVSDLLGLPRTSEFGQSEVLTCLLLCIKKGYGQRHAFYIICRGKRRSVVPNCEIVC